MTTPRATGTNTVSFDLEDGKVRVTVLIAAIILISGGTLSLAGTAWGIFAYADGRWNEANDERATIASEVEAAQVSYGHQMAALTTTIDRLNTSVSTLQTTIDTQLRADATERTQLVRRQDAIEAEIAAIRATRFKRDQFAEWCLAFSEANRATNIIVPKPPSDPR